MKRARRPRWSAGASTAHAGQIGSWRSPSQLGVGRARGMRTTAKRDGDAYILNGTRRTSRTVRTPTRRPLRQARRRQRHRHPPPPGADLRARPRVGRLRAVRAVRRWASTPPHRRAVPHRRCRGQGRCSARPRRNRVAAGGPAPRTTSFRARRDGAWPRRHRGVLRSRSLRKDRVLWGKRSGVPAHQLKLANMEVARLNVENLSSVHRDVGRGRSLSLAEAPP